MPERKTNIRTIKNIEIDPVKVEKVKDYYNVFRDILKVEEEELHQREHVWIMGIDTDGYVACVYIVALGGEKLATVAIIDIFATAVKYKSMNVVMAHNHSGLERPSPSEFDLDFTNKLLHRAKYLDIKLVDHIIISRLSLTSKKPVYYSLMEEGHIEKFENDIKYQAVDDVRHILEKEKEDAVTEGREEEKIQMIKNMLAKKYTLEQIAEVIGCEKEEIEDIIIEIESGKK